MKTTQTSLAKHLRKVAVLIVGLLMPLIQLVALPSKIILGRDKKKITTQAFIKKYLKGDGLKMISVLNNKIVLQEDEKIHLFTLKSESESSRFVDNLSSHFFKIKRGDCLFVKDYSTAQRKSLYTLLESAGIDKKILYRKFTTLPQSK